MRIDSSSVSLYGKSASVEIHTKEESLKMWTGNARPVFEDEKKQIPASAGMNLPSGDILQLSQEGKEALEKQIGGTAGCSKCSDDEELLELSDKDKQKIYLLQKMIETLTGKRIKFLHPKKINLDKHQSDKALEKLASITGANAGSAGQAPQKQGWGLEYDLHETHYEKQVMSFSAKGSVKTSDGKEIDFDLALNMSREFASRTDVSLRAGDAVVKDPLVVNFGTSSASLTTQKYSFDIDSDGTSDQISFTGAGSGFLAFDINNDGTINNGSELFGPQSGNGFNDLAQYDSDSNGWIDENDEIYDKLRIWTKDENGNDQLFAIGEKGIGAIYLGSAATAFDMKTSSNDTLGSIARSGIYLTENGRAGTIQHVDLVI